MLIALALTVLAASPEAGTRWQWKLTDTKSARGTVFIDKRLRSFLPVPPLVLDLEVTGGGQPVPSRFDVTVTEGLALKGTHFEVQNSWGEAAVRRRLGEADPEDDDAHEEQVRRVRTLLNLLMKPDPVVQAATSDAPCSPEALEAVAAATAKLVSVQLSPGSGDEFFASATSAACTGKGSRRKYAVRFTLTRPNGTFDVSYPFSGTVEVPKGAWRANYEVKAPFEHVTSVDEKELPLRGTVTLKNQMTKR